MPSNRQRGSRVIYVAASARELPEDVQDWLSQGSNRAAASPNIYDALATLAVGKRPTTALIVSMAAVDWNELEFFDLVARVSRDTHVFVVGPPYEDAKIEAACARGAELFSAEKLDEALSVTEAPPMDAEGLVAGSVAKDPQRPTAARPINVEPPKEEHRPSVRLVTPSETDDEVTVPVPWAPSASRPQRTPPKPIEPPPIAAPDAEEERPVEERPRTRRPPPQVKLTPEELAALLGRPTEGEAGAAKEGGS
jgi:hypothetical protein